LVNFKEFGKVFVKYDLENDLYKHKIYKEEDLDIPFTFPNTAIFAERIAVYLASFRVS
jgi:hypothetical protein